jgi:S-formylglutathione hydrolase FrmB
MNADTFRTLECSDPAITAEGLTFATVKSRALGRRADVTLYVPRAARGMTGVPIVMLLHGVYGSHWAWALKGAAHMTAARLIAAGALPPVAVLMPSDGLWGDGSGYVRHGDADPEAWIIEEVPALARELVPGCDAGSPLLVAGLSMGGFGALRLAGKHAARIAAAAGISSVVEASQFDALIEEDRRAWSRGPGDRDVLGALMNTGETLPPLRIDCGLSDPYLESNRELHRNLSHLGIAHTYVESPGGHDWEYWSATLEHTLRFFGAVLQLKETAA